MQTLDVEGEERRRTHLERGAIYIRDRGEALRGSRTIIDHKGRQRAAMLVGQAEERQRLASAPASRQSRFSRITKESKRDSATVFDRCGGTACMGSSNTLSEEDFFRSITAVLHTQNQRHLRSIEGPKDARRPFNTSYKI
ncbi:hypothetical protein PGTUg99_035004 [Puccinia graminis f. sp. tritici]|uniref:Uncharacterized protein n=1 Tax=Puccinia graminis f. sp. tritici TaxID=56615 RepID=A0A5B0SEJ2_PUCGR|nr:hypothetical protein PGTUg99_035004 [Puccinia graminis f. sp. tritici]